MRDREETRDPVKRGAVFVNYEALNTWLRFGTPIPPIDHSEHRSLVGTELLRWQGYGHVARRPGNRQRRNKLREVV